MPSTKGRLQASIVPVLYKSGFIEENLIDITDFAKEFCRKNAKAGLAITRHDIEWYWEGNVRSELDTLDPIHHRLISQIKSPKFERFWLNRTASEALQARKISQEQESFWLLKPNVREKKTFANALILGDHTERWIIPNVSLMAIEDVFFNDCMRRVRVANFGGAGNSLDQSTKFRLWGALIKKAYDFVAKEVQNEKLKEVRSIPVIDHYAHEVDHEVQAFSGHPPTTEEGLEEFYGMASRKRKSAPGSEGGASDEEYSEPTQKRRRVSIGVCHIREFDNESILNPTLKPILENTHPTSSDAIAGSSASASLPPSTKLDSGEGGDNMVEMTEKRVQTLEKELAELKIANAALKTEKDELEHSFRSQNGMRLFEEVTKNASLQLELKEARDLVARLEQRSPKNQ